MSKRRKLIGAAVAVGLCITAVLYFTMKEDPTDKRIEEYDEIVEEIKNGFTYDGFIEVMGDKTHMLGLPMEYEQIEQNGIFLDMQKLFVYKSTDNGIIILLQVVLNPFIESKDRWISSMNYNSMTFNSIDSMYGEFVNEKIPTVEIATNSFSYHNVDYSITVIAEENELDEATTTLMDFCNNFIPFLVIKNS